MHGFIARLSALVGVSALGLTLLATAPVQAVPSDSQRTTTQSTGPFGLVSKDHIVLTVTARETSGNHDPNDKAYSKLLWRKTGDATTFMSTGSGGVSESSGCKTIRLTNTGKSFLFRTVLFRYVTDSHWCWTRSTKNTYSHSDTWTFTDLAIGVSWLGEVDRSIGAFYWGGSQWGGYRHYRRGGFQSLSLCFNIGCNNYSYPGNDFYEHMDGTWNYNVFGADS